MKSATVALALHTELDVAAVRRLHDYGTLDDDNVTRAYEQVRAQRAGRLRRCDWPAYLRRVVHLSAVIDNGDGVQLLSLDARSDEAAALRRLSQQWPRGEGSAVFWREDVAALLGVRAFLHEARIAAGLVQWPRISLATHLNGGIEQAVGADAPDGDQSESDMARMLGVHPPPIPIDTRVDALAVNRYRWWLRWQHGQGAIDAEQRERREAALSGTSRTRRVGS